MKSEGEIQFAHDAMSQVLQATSLSSADRDIFIGSITALRWVLDNDGNRGNSPIDVFLREVLANFDMISIPEDGPGAEEAI